jgi:hypothetical protein
MIFRHTGLLTVSQNAKTPEGLFKLNQVVGPKTGFACEEVREKMGLGATQSTNQSWCVTLFLGLSAATLLE